MDTQALTISWEGKSFPCRIGQGGTVDAFDKREGDGATPRGIFPLRYGFYRPDRLPAPTSRLAFHPVTTADLWCDTPDHPAYNRWVKAPFSASHEDLMRDDIAYDLILVIGHNDDPPITGLGSAVFIHLDRPDHRSTLGCIAVEPDTLIAILRAASPGDEIDIC